MKQELFRTDVTRSNKVQIDRHNSVISGFAVVTKGITKDARGEFDDASLDTVVALGNKSKLGIKSRFGHPNMSSTALGTFLGRVKNFRRDHDIVRADLYIDKTAFNTPDGDLAGYVFDLAESDPEMFGSSMVIYWDEEKREELDTNGNELPPFIRVQKLLSVDIVDDPAANNGFFGMPFFSDSVKPSAGMTSFLDQFLNNPEAVDKTIGFLNKYQINRESFQSQQIQSGKEKETMLEELTMEQLKEKRSDLFDAVKAEGFEAGVKQERDRTVSILKKAEAFEGMNTLALEAVEKGLSTEQATITFQDKKLNDLEKAAEPKVGPDFEQEPKQKLSHLEKAKKYQEENGGSMTEALKHTAEKRN